MSMAASIVKELEKKLEKTPGFGYVALIASAAFGTVSKSTSQEPDWSIALLTVAVALAAYWCGGFLDDVLFEPFYGLPVEERHNASWATKMIRSWFVEPVRRILGGSVLAAAMADARQRAAESFHAPRQEGIYKTAKKLLSGTEEWEGRITLALDLSKTARTLILPSLLLLLWKIGEATAGVAGPTFLGQHQATAWLLHPLGQLSVGIVSTVVYVNLRLRHMRFLYEELTRVPKCSFQIQSESGPVTLWSVGDKVIAQSRLPLFN